MTSEENILLSRTRMPIQYIHIPTEILGLIESYLPPSNCAHLSATCTSLHRRWTARRWQRTFQMHYCSRDRLRMKERMKKVKKARRRFVNLRRKMPSINNEQNVDLCGGGIFSSMAGELSGKQSEQLLTEDDRMLLQPLQHGNSIANMNVVFDRYDECYKDGWEFTFVGCCHDDKYGDVCAKCKLPADRSSATTTTVCSGDNCSRSKRYMATNEQDHRQCILREESYDDDMSAFTTQFNVTALVPSVRRLYVDLWDTIELSLLGYYDADETETRPGRGGLFEVYLHRNQHSQYPVPAIMRILRTSVLPELAEYLYFVVGFKPLAIRGMDNRASRRRSRRRNGGVMGPMVSRGRGGVRLGLDDPQQQQPQQGTSFGSTTTLEEINSLRDAATTMSAWKLACFLRQRGVGCLRCVICDRIDLMEDYFEEDDGDADVDGRQATGRGEEDSDGEIHDGMDPRNNGLSNIPQESRNGRRSSFLREFQRQIGDDAWMTPCQCPELVHRQCLERRLKLIPKYEPWEQFKLIFGRVYTMLCGASSSMNKGDAARRSKQSFSVPSRLMEDENTRTDEPIAPRVWISYDNTIPVRRGWWGHGVEEEDAVIDVDHLGRFRSTAAMCETCGGRFLRTVRLPRSKWEVLAASLSDPISMMRAASTFIHFVLACAFIAACEGMCVDDSCRSHRTLLSTPWGVLKWPTTGLNGLALAWWQLQQCCMLHIFVSQRFAAIVDRLWMGPISLFYCRLYFYFVLTSALLATSYIPMISRTIRINFLEPLISSWILESLQPIWDAIAFANLFQYAVVSTTVVCIFWRTHYRIFTVADGKEAAATVLRREELARNMQVAAAAGRQQREVGQNNINDGAQGGDAVRDADPVAVVNALPMQRIVGIGAGDGNAANHPIYHGPW